MDITVSQEQGTVPVTVFHITGAITANQQLERYAQEAYDNGARNILLDLTEVPYIATSGLRALHMIYTLLRTDSPTESDDAVKAGIRSGAFTSPHLKLLKPSAHVMEVLKIAGYDMFLQIYRSKQDALASFS